jgi:hypothetical protein
MAAVTPEDVEEITRKLVESAKQGDVVAIRELLDRTIGKPVAALAVTGADGEPLIHFEHVQQVILSALGGFPEARIHVAMALRGLIDARLAGSIGDGAGPGDDDGGAGDDA